MVRIHEELKLTTLSCHPLKRASHVPWSIVTVADNDGLLKVVVAFQEAFQLHLNLGKVCIDELTPIYKSVPLPVSFLLHAHIQLNPVQLIVFLLSGLFLRFLALQRRIFAVYPRDVEPIAFDIERVRLNKLPIRLCVNG